MSLSYVLAMSDADTAISGGYAEKSPDGLWDGYISGNSELWRKIWADYAFLVWDDEFFETGGRKPCGAGACAADAGKTERDLL